LGAYFSGVGINSGSFRFRRYCCERDIDRQSIVLSVYRVVCREFVSQPRPWPECCLDKILGGSFTGELSVDPTYLRALRQTSSNELQATEPLEASVEVGSAMEAATSERRRRIRDAVEAALSDVIPFESGSGYWKP
jgi:hypothetical protein